MARLSRLSVGAPVALELLHPGSRWRIDAPLNLYSHWLGSGLATQAWAGRALQVLDDAAPTGRRVRVRLLEDGYPGWIDPRDLLGHARCIAADQPRLLCEAAIADRLPAVLAFADAARQQSNHYLWGGSLGPDFDCSGFTQAAYAAAGVWIPRDAYQQERFCQPVAVAPGCYSPVSYTHLRAHET